MVYDMFFVSIAIILSVWTIYLNEFNKPWLVLLDSQIHMHEFFKTCLLSQFV